MRLDASTPDSTGRRRATIATLRAAGEHPLMCSFPLGAIYSFDQDLRFLSAGGLGLADVGLSRELLEGRTIFEVFTAETAAQVEPFYRAALAGASPTWDVSLGGRTFAHRLAPATDPVGVVVAGLGFTQDVTEERAAQAALRESEQRNRLSFGHDSIGKAIVALDGSWRQVNAALVQLLGYDEEQLLTMTFQDVTHPDDLDLDLSNLKQLLDGEISSYHMEKRYFTAEGRTVWVLLSVSLARDEQGVPLYFVSQVQDVTASKHHQEALQDLTGMLAHDLRNPAAVIQGFSEELEALTGSEFDEVRDFASRITASARAITNLLDNALTATAIDAGAAVAVPQSVNVHDAVVAVLGLIDMGTAVVDLTAVDDVEAWVDPVNLQQVLGNLLTNAAKYGGGTVAVSAAASADRTRVRLSVADDGRGVEADFVPHLFDRFSRSPRARTDGRRGSGLGLYIVHDLVVTNGGAITYSPARTGGAEFVVDLPAPSDA